MINGFLLGSIVTASLIASAFFLKFWKQTRDPLFLSFAAAFAVESLNRTMFLVIDNPTDGNAVIYSIRLFSYLLILAAIVQKNRA